MLGARRRASPTRSRSPVTIDAHRSLKRTERFHPTQKGPAAQSERNHSTLHKKAPLPKANGTIPPYTKRPRSPKRTEPFHPTQKGPAAQSERNHSTLHKKAPAARSERNHSTLHKKAPLPKANGTLPRIPWPPQPKRTEQHWHFVPSPPTLPIMFYPYPSEHVEKILPQQRRLSLTRPERMHQCQKVRNVNVGSAT